MAWASWVVPASPMGAEAPTLGIDLAPFQDWGQITAHPVLGMMWVQSWKEGHTLSIYYAPGTVQGIAHSIVLCFFIFKINIFLYCQCLIFLYILYVETKDKCNDLSCMDYSLQNKLASINPLALNKHERWAGQRSLFLILWSGEWRWRDVVF